MAGEKPASHRVLGKGWVGGEVKDPRSSGLCSCQAWGHIRSSLLRFPRGHITEVRTPSLYSTAGGTLRFGTVSPQGVPSSFPTAPLASEASLPALCPVQQPALGAQSGAGRGLEAGPRPHPPQAPEKANRGHCPPLPLFPLGPRCLRIGRSLGAGERGARPAPASWPAPAAPPPAASPHSPAPGSGPAGRAGPGRAGGTCSSGGP